MNKDIKRIINIFSRYIAILILGAANLYIIYKVLTPLTIHVTNIILKIFAPTTLAGDIIHFQEATIQIAPACVAGSAFYLLLALLLSIGNVKFQTRLKAIGTAVLILFVLNVARIIILAFLITTSNFELIHWIFWHLVSTIFVVATYITTIKIYKIKSIPVYSDFKYIKGLTKKK